MHAMTSAAIVHKIATGCAQGSILDCYCDVKAKHFKTFHSNCNSYFVELFFVLRKKILIESLFSLSLPLSPYFEIVLFAENYCNNYISYAYRKSKEFLDENLWKKRNDFKNQILLHNYEAGRLVSSINLDSFFEINPQSNLSIR